MHRLFLPAALMLAGAVAQVGERYVAMGSLYAAGAQIGEPDPASAGCARSTSNFAWQAARRRHLDLVDVSCSGATTDTVLVHGQHGFPAQIAAVTPDTQLVSILMGGNDVAYVGHLLGLSVDDAEVERRFVELPGALDRVIGEVCRRAPSARITLVGYLPAVPVDEMAARRCRSLLSTSCMRCSRRSRI